MLKVIVAITITIIAALIIFATAGASVKKETPITNGTFTAIYHAEILCTERVSGKLTLVYRNNNLVRVEFNNKSLPLAIFKYPHNVAKGGEFLLDLRKITTIGNVTEGNVTVTVRRARPASHDESPYKARSSLIISTRAVIKNLTVPGVADVYYGTFHDSIDFDDVANVPYHFAITIFHPSARSMGCSGAFATIFATLVDVKN
ncbi:hypothetical protein [Pyrobaculum aerophilum]|uniref:hypothetical protein n=1 Tax=Pyrobaculum aerophilum TaxID=13773 RepID=UPI0023F08540|nr:hypothetical protein [Pyrobaculum aerophilum]MCX8136428.1 hypothetical protein [Pyrobaculum aerophilum]